MDDVHAIDESRAVSAPAENFTGPVRMQRLSDEAGSQEFEVFAVFFEAGSHTRPHTHPGEQILHFFRGDGFYQLAGEERQAAPEGTVVVVPAGVVHMHGATDDAAICHIAARAANGPTDWSPAGIPDEWRRFSQP